MTQGSLTRRGASAVKRVRVRVTDPALRRRLEQGVARAIEDALEASSGTAIPAMIAAGSVAEVGKLRARLEGSLVVIDTTRVDAGRLRRLVAVVERAQPAGIQLTWGKAGALPAAMEEAVFEVLEERRGADGRAPVLLSRSSRPAKVWRQLLAARRAAQGRVP